ncbi:DUF494 domain-containing protein [candidate division KSB1 bacterium]|nr:DUF494 domain-containing protein [candidate division KSB1 bacterium]NIR72421.1 DUF494 domain-containing protein [candidate division KSB1 bacterium]NIS23586.1 DUF494 domain-containing protein [candidate division KSB1 bacterium]NIT70512.1 DUF494 domain-containing protein [candidate division KSB1 bacterium]NIU24220.1 DUF494 domain-containing protein [candidate division KSB1 bacterium]
MNERIVEILIYIMSEIRRSSKGAKKLDLLSKDLIKQGYTEGEISSAFSWLLHRFRSESDELIPNQGSTLKNSFRLLHEIENSVVTTEAYGYIIQLKELEIISELDMEHILDRAMMLGTTKVTVEDVKTIVAAMLNNHEGLGDGAYFMFDEEPVIQ